MTEPQVPTRRTLLRPSEPPPGWGRSATVGLSIGIAAVLALLAVRLFSPVSAGDALSDAAQDFITLSASVIIESLPFVFLGIVLSIAVQLWLPADFLTRRLPSNGFLRRAIISLLGILLPVCECGNVPLARGLLQRGLTVGESMTFLLAAPILNPVTIITTYQAFGWDDGILFWRIVGGFLIANLVGWVFSRHPDPTSMLTPTFQELCRREHADHSSKVHRGARMFIEETSAMLPALFVGSAVAGLIQVAASRDILITLGQNPVLSVFALMLLAFVVALCSNVDVFFVLAFGSTFMPGAIVAFLVFGPMIDVKMLALMRTTFTTRTLVQLTAIVALASAALGLGVNLAA
ncbi:permease [Agromyces sp. NPDC058110]|uniref:permease n=1 Tax=Agromyces sp. NPDC058110 TaxID=3346345 RepID=UPI0036D806AD